MLITPHPDDEVLLCGIVMQRAVGAGAAVVLFMPRMVMIIPNMSSSTMPPRRVKRARRFIRTSLGLRVLPVLNLSLRSIRALL
jgi:hypothetical protein